MTDNKLRNLAKTVYWQNIYNASQKCSNIQIFNNVANFSSLQVRFLHWLSVYKLLNDEIATHEDSQLTQAVIEDEYRTDAYLIHRNKKNDYLWKKHKREERETQIKANRTKNFKHPGKETTIDVELRSE